MDLPENNKHSIQHDGDKEIPEENNIYTEENDDVDIDDIIATDNDLTFQQARLVVTDINSVPRVTSYTNLVDINLSFSGEDLNDNDSHAQIDTNKITDRENNTNVSENKYKQNDIDVNNVMENDSDIDGDSQSFDCAKFLLILRSLSTQKSKGINCSEESKNTDKPENVNGNEELTSMRKEKFSDLTRLQENFNNWTNKIKKVHLLNIKPEDWGMELSDMVGDSSTSEETRIDFEKLKTVDVWQQISHYIKSKMRTK